jgi:hypothetical protein
VACKCTDEALLQQAQILRLRDANKSDLNVVREWILHPDGGKDFFWGREADPWKKENTEDLVSLTGCLDGKDRFTLWIRDKVVPYVHSRCCWRIKVMWFLIRNVAFITEILNNATQAPSDPEKLIWKYSQSHISAATNIVSAILSALLPTSSILLLYFLKSPLAKLGAVVGLTTVFSISLAVVVKSRRIEIFAVTSA